MIVFVMAKVLGSYIAFFCYESEVYGLKKHEV